MTDTPKAITIDVAADKYRYIAQMDGTVTAYRNGQVWFEGTNIARGNNMLAAICARLHEAEALIGDLSDYLHVEVDDPDVLKRLKEFEAPNPNYPHR